MVDGEMHIGLADRAASVFRRLRRAGGCFEPEAEAAKAKGGELAQQPGQVAEMVLRRRLGGTGLARGGAQRQAVDAVAVEDALAGLQKRLAQRAVVIGSFSARSAGRVRQR